MTIRHKGRTFLVYHRKRRKAMKTEEILSSWGVGLSNICYTIKYEII